MVDPPAWAPWSRRAVALIVDILILFPVVLLLRFAGLSTALVGLAQGVLIIIYAGLLQSRSARNGQTLGQQWLGVRVTRDNGRPLSFPVAALRQLLVTPPLAVLGYSVFRVVETVWLVNYLWPLWDSENRALHDIAVRTHVFRVGAPTRDDPAQNV